MTGWAHDGFRRRGILFAGLAMLIFSLGVRAGRPPAREAVITEGVCRLLLENSTAGRQALVGSAWWPPMPALMQTPAAAVTSRHETPVAAMIVSALFGAAALVLMLRTLGEWGAPAWARTGIAASFAASPPFLAGCLEGSPAVASLFFAMLAARGLAEWVERHEVRSLVHLAAGTALLFLTDFEMSVWSALVFAFLALDVSAMRPRPDQRAAVLILALLPVVYCLGLWILLNWLVMGDGLCFLRSLISASRSNLPPADPRSFLAPVGWAAAAAATVFALAAAMRDRAAAMLAATAAAVPVCALLLNAFGLPANMTALGSTATALAILAAAFWAARRRTGGPAGWVFAMLLSCALLAKSISAGAPDPDLGATDDQTEILYRLERHVLGRSPYAKVFVCGYDGIRLLWNTSGPVFEYAMDFNFDTVRRDYAGHRIFVLVHRPEGLSAADSVHWRYPDLYRYGGHSALYDGDWGEWRLFEIIEPPLK